MYKISVAICDDADFLCRCFQNEIDTQEDMIFAGKANSAKECIELVRNNVFDILLLDIQMESETSGLDIIKLLKEIRPELKIIIITSHFDGNYILSAFSLEADNYILKDTDSNVIFDIIRDVYYERSKLDSDIAKALAKITVQTKVNNASVLYLVKLISKLSVSELEILKLLYEGKSYREIAALRVVEEGTVRVAASRTLRKLGYKKMNHLIDFLQKNKILDLFS